MHIAPLYHLFLVVFTISSIIPPFWSRTYMDLQSHVFVRRRSFRTNGSQSHFALLVILAMRWGSMLTSMRLMRETLSYGNRLTSFDHPFVSIKTAKIVSYLIFEVPLYFLGYLDGLCTCLFHICVCLRKTYDLPSVLLGHPSLKLCHVLNMAWVPQGPFEFGKWWWQWLQQHLCLGSPMLRLFTTRLTTENDWNAGDDQRELRWAFCFLLGSHVATKSGL